MPGTTDAGSAPSSTMAARVPAAPPIWIGKVRAVSPSYASRTPVSHWAALSPKVVGTACWVRVRPTMTVPRWATISAASRSACPRMSVWIWATASWAISISAVSSTSWLVSPRCSQRAASGCSSSSEERSSPTSPMTGLPPASVSSVSHSWW